MRSGSGVQRLVVADTADVRPSDLDTIPFEAADVGHPREERAAARLRRLNPDVDVQSLGVPLTSTHEVVRALQSVGCDQVAASDRDSDASSDEGADIADYGEDDAQPPLHLVVLCVRLGELALRLNDLCCALGVPLAVAFMGSDGMSGESLLVVPGVSSCLQCLDKRKMWKVTPTAAPTADGTAGHSGVGPALPSSDCVLAGLCVQNAVMCVPHAPPRGESRHVDAC
jgi:molybdopterin/thiamine biosynthesis adenylyltransferase